MSFLSGGAECSTGANPLSQFQKHVQDDKSLQRDRMVGRGPGGMQEGFRSREAPGHAVEMMDEFMQQPAHMPPTNAPPFAMEQMRHELNQIGPQQRNGSPQNWAGEFSPEMSTAHMPQQHGGFNPAEFERFQHAQSGSAMSGTAPGMNTYQRPMGMGYNSIYGGTPMGGMGMGMGMRPSFGMQAPGEPVFQGKGKEKIVELDDKDWEAQFAELDKQHYTEDLDEEARAAMEAQLDQIDRSVSRSPSPSQLSDTDRFGNFERLWQNVQTESAHIRSMMDEQQHWQTAGDEFDDLQEWQDFDGGLNHHFNRDPELGNYMFEEENFFKELADPFGEGVRIMDEGGNLSLAALAFEAAVQRDPSHVEAWTRLGAAQAQNEKETPAIRALEQAIKLDPANLTALMGLAVSYTNEGYDSTAYRTLERWLSTKYPQIGGRPDDGINPTDPASAELGFTDRQVLHERVTDLFIRAAQLSPDPSTMDPDVQVGLGVLFYGAEEFDKAVDCFSAALQSSESGVTNTDKANQRPLLWNRLGATLANSGRSEEAIEAYEKALQLNPNFVRARYNLGVSCVNIGCYAEAAQHLLGALSMHAVVAKEAKEKAREIVGDAAGTSAEGVGDDELERIMRQNQSTNLYDTLRRVFGQMGRKDLAEKVVNGVDVDVFRGEFDF